MASVTSEDDSSFGSDKSALAKLALSKVIIDEIRDRRRRARRSMNIVQRLRNREIYGRITKHPKAKTERMFNEIFHRCRQKFSKTVPRMEMYHIFMGFTLCGRFVISYTEKMPEEPDPGSMFPPTDYELYIWRFVPGEELKFVSKHRIFKLYSGPESMDEVMFMQFPNDPYKLICYGIENGNSPMTFITILTLPTTNCKNCKELKVDDGQQGWCMKHGFILHLTFSLTQPAPTFNPDVSLAYPDHLVINTGTHIHIINVTTLDPPHTVQSLIPTFTKMTPQSTFAETLSELSESMSEHYETSSVVDAILEDFNEYDMEGSECNKPFHELNISCEPLNVTGKNYNNYNSLVQNVIDSRIRHLHNLNKDRLFSVPHCSGVQKNEKSNVDKNIAEKAYEFTEDNEKCEKLSSFRKKRLADKKYEFSEDNSENIVPFYSLRRERRYLYRPQPALRSPECNSLFLSPRSPMQSPNSRNGQFSPGGARNIYSPIIRNSPYHCKSPVSPRESSKGKPNVNSPGLESDCSESDSRLIFRHVHNLSTSHDGDHRLHHHSGLLIVDTKREETPKWIKKVVRRYSSIDFENSSLLSGQSRGTNTTNDYNIPIEIPLLVQTLTEQQLDVVPEMRTDEVSETQLIITQKALDCEQFVQARAQKLCLDAQLEFLHLEDYDINLLYVCPLNGDIVCQAEIIIGVLQDLEPYGKRSLYVADCLFTWNATTNDFELIEPPEKYRLRPRWHKSTMLSVAIPSVVHKKVLVMDQLAAHSKTCLRDYENYNEIRLDSLLPRYY